MKNTSVISLVPKIKNQTFAKNVLKVIKTFYIRPQLI